MDNVKPKKRLGQHFLHDRNIARKIAAGVPEDAHSVVEIGPGTGALTRFLVDRFPRLVLVEFDGESVEFLKKEYKPEQIEVVHGDFLKWDLQEEIAADTDFVGNLPYNVTSPILFRLLENLSQVRSGYFMVQKEVADRICAKEGNKTYGILSVLLGYYFDLKYEFTVGRKVFLPPPKVTSAVFSMKRKPEIPPVPFSVMKPLVKAAFQQRRKTLRNALKAFNFQDTPEIKAMLSQRAEQLTTADFEKLAQSLKEND